MGQGAGDASLSPAIQRLRAVNAAEIMKWFRVLAMPPPDSLSLALHGPQILNRCIM